MRALLFHCLAVSSAIWGGAAHASDPINTWAHNDWTALQYDGYCEIRTGGDGDGTLAVTFDTGGYNPSLAYTPVFIRGYSTPIDMDTYFRVFIDTEETYFGEELFAYSHFNEWNETVASAGLTPGFVPDILAQMRGGIRIAFEVKNVGALPAIYDDFSLMGASATLLKISEWCSFNPNALATP